MKISVVMGIYNSEKTLRESLDSMVTQSFQDFEIIVCDDGSQDNTLAIAQSYKSFFHNRLTILVNPVNKGLAYSLNKCLAVAKGEYVARMDADDIAMRNRFELQLNYLDNHPDIAMVGCSVLLFDDKGIWGTRTSKESPGKKDFLKTSQFVHPTILIRKKVLTDLDGYAVEKSTLRAEDYDLFMRFYAEGYKGSNLPDTLLLYREDASTFKRRSYNNRFDEMKVRYRGFKRMDLLPLGFPYVIKPLIVGLIPQRVLKILRREQHTPLLKTMKVKS
ncbi:glycosyltransferase [Alkalibacterium sp. f15]|uniref:glycosyltransferase n=1 Tax=Alkalibacterium sp. f15 TaxID=3414029 RepID=UPI003BF7DF1C